MSSYVGGILIGVESYPIGSTLYGICNTDANALNKKVVLSQFDQLLPGITVHVKFIKGNTVSSGTTLQFYPTDGENVSPNMENVTAIPITGAFICETNSIISFTLDDLNGTKYWRVNDAVKVEEGTTNCTIKVNGEEISIHGLGTAAYTDSSAYATSTHNHDTVYAPINNPTFTGIVTLPSIDSNSNANAAATKYYVDSKTQGLEGISGAMHYIDAPNATFTVTYPTPTEQNPNPLPTVTVGGTFPADYAPEAGDLIVYQHQEFVYTGSTWRLLGDEGSYVFKSSQTTASIGSASGWNAGSVATLGDPIGIDGITNWDAGSASAATVANGILTLTNSVIPTLTHSVTNVPNVTSAGTAPSLTITSTTVVVPNTSSSI